jgi:predicted lactoylglutathione lyase
MPTDRFVISLPVADRVRSRDFYRDALGLEAPGPPADDGVPEPLHFPLGDDAVLMLVPTGGFGWVVGEREVAEPGTSECVLSVGASSDAEVDATVERARSAGATVVTEAGDQPWGYAGAFADPDGHVWMITSAPFPPEPG